MTGVDSYSTTPLNNETVDGTTTWREGQLPSTVNNGLRQLLTDLRERFNDLPWFQYGNGDQDTSTHLAKPCVYASATSFTVSGNGDQTAAYHAGRPLRAVGTLTGTIYGVIASSSYNGGTGITTVNATWTSGTLSSEALVISIGLPVLGQPTPARGICSSTFEISHERDGGGSAIATGECGDEYVDWAFEITGWVIQADQAGDMELDIWAKDYADDDPPTVGNSIVASLPPALSGNQYLKSTTLTDWTTSFTGPTALRYKLTSLTTITRYKLTLICRRT